MTRQDDKNAHNKQHSLGAGSGVQLLGAGSYVTMGIRSKELERLTIW